MRRVYTVLFEGKAAMWTALFTFALAVFSGLLLRVSRDANDASIETQRAFINVSDNLPMSKVGDEKGLTGYQFNVAIINSGDTPTKIASYQVACRVQDSAPEKGTNFEALPEGERVSQVFGPKMASGVAPFFISIADLESVAQKSNRAFIWGWVEYRDIFKDTPMRLSEFCVQILTPRWSKPVHSDPTGDVVVSFAACPSHNCYDENCEDYFKRAQELQ
jgi:hypothetical protein